MKSTPPWPQVMIQSEAILKDPSQYWISVIKVGYI